MPEVESEDKDSLPSANNVNSAKSNSNNNTGDGIFLRNSHSPRMSNLSAQPTLYSLQDGGAATATATTTLPTEDQKSEKQQQKTRPSVKILVAEVKTLPISF